MIRHLGGTLFEVPSFSGEEPYVVDISANGGNGVCLCRNFVTSRQGNYDRAGKTIEYDPRDKAATRCKHIHAVILYLGNLTAKRIADAA